MGGDYRYDPPDDSTSTPDSGTNPVAGNGQGGSADEDNGSVSSPDESNASLAKACAPHFRGIGTKIKVLSVSSATQAVTISPDTVLAIHLSGNQNQIDLNLGASSGIAGVCLILTGNQSAAKISSASSFNKLVYVGRGNLSQGQIAMQDGASIASANIELSGKQAKLAVNGVADGSCSTAKMKGNSPELQCTK